MKKYLPETLLMLNTIIWGATFVIVKSALTDISFAGIILSFEPIFAAVFAFFMLNEKISNFGLIGCLLIFCGLIISEIYKKKNG